MIYSLMLRDVVQTIYSNQYKREPKPESQEACNIGRGNRFHGIKEDKGPVRIFHSQTTTKGWYMTSYNLTVLSPTSFLYCFLGEYVIYIYICMYRRNKRESKGYLFLHEFSDF